MAKVDKPQAQPKTTKRRQSLPFTIVSWRGRLYARSKATGKRAPATPAQLRWVENFKCDQRAAKFADPHSRLAAEEFSRDTGWYPRDTIVAALNGNILRHESEPPITTPTVSLFRDSDQALTNGVTLKLTPNDKRWDNNAFWNPAVNPERITFNASGLYLLTLRLWLKPGSATVFGAYVQTSDGEVPAQFAAMVAASSDGVVSATGLAYMNAATYAEAFAYVFVAGRSVRVQAFEAVAITPEALIP